MATAKEKEAEENMTERSCCQELREEFRLHRLKLDHPHPVHFVSLQCFKSTFHHIWSGFWAVYHFAMLILDIYYERDAGGEYLSFLTNWSYIIVAGFSIADFVITIYVHGKRKDIVEQKDPTLSTPWYMKVHWIVFNIVNSASVIVTLLYYALLDVAWTHSSTNKHLLNSVYALVNLLFSAKPVRLLHVYHPFIYAVVYIIFNVIYFVSGGGVVYSALDWGQTGSAVLLAALVLFLGIPVVHTFCFALYTLRVFISSKCCNSNVNVSNGAKQNIQREITPRDVALYEISQSRPQTRTSNARPGTNKPDNSVSRPTTNRPGTNKPQTAMSILPV